MTLSAQPHVASAASTSRTSRLLLVALVLAAAVPYLRTLAFGYVMDDTTAIRGNPDMAGWVSLLTVWAHPYGGEGSPFFGLYRPLTMAVFAFVWNAGGHWPLWFHILAVTLHAVATLLVYRMLLGVSGRLPAFVGALWFAVHPVHVEAVANVANSSEVLVTIWTCLLALHLARADDQARENRWSTAILAGLLYLLAFLSKESGAVAPLLAFLWVWMRGRGQAGAGLAEAVIRWRRPIAAFAAVAIAVIIVRAIVLGGPVTGEPIGTPGLAELSSLERVRAMLSLGPRIVGLLVWPATLNPHYGPTAFPTHRMLWAVLAIGALTAIVALTLWHARRGDRRWLGAVAWIVVAFFPASNLLVATGQILAERTLYVSSIGVAMVIATAVDVLSAQQLRVGRAVASAVVMLAGVAAFRTTEFVEIWRDHPSLFGQIIAADSSNYRGYWLMGLEARNSGSTAEAIELLGRAHRMYPSDRGLMIDYRETLSRADSARIRAPR